MELTPSLPPCVPPKAYLQIIVFFVTTFVIQSPLTCADTHNQPSYATGGAADRPATVHVGPTANCYTSSDVVRAFANQGIQNIRLMNDIMISDGDWASYSVPLALERNVTVEGFTPERSAWVVLDFNFVKSKILLRRGLLLEFKYIVIYRAREPPSYTMPGFDIIAPGPVPGPNEPNSTWPLLLVKECLSVQRTCLPVEYQAAYLDKFDFENPFPQNNSLQLNIFQVGCVNCTTARPTARCWPELSAYGDIGTYAMQIDEKKVPSRAGYLINVHGGYGTCMSRMTLECINATGSWGGCYMAMFPNASVEPPLVGIGSAVAVGPDCAAGQGGGGGGGGVSSSQLAAILGGVLGGAGLLAVVGGVVAVAAVVRKRRRRQAYGELVTTGGKSSTGHGPASAISAGCAATNSAYPTSTTETTAAAAAAGQVAAMVEGHLTVVSTLTPQHPDLKLGVECDNEVQLEKGAVLGKGSCGVVVVGRYKGARVAVKLLHTELLPVGQSAEAVAAAVDDGDTADGTALASTADDDMLGTEDDAHGGDCGTTPTCGIGGRDVCRKGGVASDGASPNSPAAPSSLLLPHLASLRQEVEVLGRCCHPNVVQLLAACITPPRPCLVIELMETSLDRVMYGSRRVPRSLLPLPVVLRIATDIAQGLSYLHPTIVHRDLKPPNVLINNPDSPHPTAKLSDFGLSRLRTSLLVTKDPEVGTPPYMAPECFDPLNFVISHQSDIYSLGVILAEMIIGRPPWHGCSIAQIAFKVTVRSERPYGMWEAAAERCPPKLGRLIQTCWDSDPRRRPAAAEVVKTLLLAQMEIPSRPA